MPKAYWIVTYRSISDPSRIVEYAKLAGPALSSMGGRYLVRGMPSKTYEAGLNERCIVIEFDSLERAIAAHDCDEYHAALEVFGDAAERDIRIVEGIA